MQTVKATVKVAGSQPGKEISPELFGIFFEDINYAADGGLYAELVQNRSFEYSAEITKTGIRSPHGNVTDGDGTGKIAVEPASPLNANNPHYAVLTVDMPAKALDSELPASMAFRSRPAKNTTFRFSPGRRPAPPASIVVRLESKSGESLGEATLSELQNKWTKYTAVITANPLRQMLVWLFPPKARERSTSIWFRCFRKKLSKIV